MASGTIPVADHCISPYCNDVPERTTTAYRSAIVANAPSCSTSADTFTTPLRMGRVAHASATTVGWLPRRNAPSAVNVTHMWVMNPMTMTCLLPAASTRSPKSVPTNALGAVLTTTGSLGSGATAG